MRLCSTSTAAPRCSSGSARSWPPPGRGELQLRHTAIGVNFIDIYDRSGLYPRALPETPGREAAGVVVALGAGVRGFRLGQRVAYVLAAAGAYSEYRNIAADARGQAAAPASATSRRRR